MRRTKAALAASLLAALTVQANAYTQDKRDTVNTVKSPPVGKPVLQQGGTQGGSQKGNQGGSQGGSQERGGSMIINRSPQQGGTQGGNQGSNQGNQPPSRNPKIPDQQGGNQGGKPDRQGRRLDLPQADLMLLQGHPQNQPDSTHRKPDSTPRDPENTTRRLDDNVRIPPGTQELPGGDLVKKRTGQVPRLDRRASRHINRNRGSPVSCEENPDYDGDGVPSLACGGTDCDDMDPTRYPGNVEVCDLEGKDEDCDPNTFGERDLDRDGFIDERCCNHFEGRSVCGDDCDDMHRSVHPGATEVCNGIDDNCDSAKDEQVVDLRMTAYEDNDRDGYGDPSRPVKICPQDLRPGLVTNDYDCDDSDPRRSPCSGTCPP